VAVGERFMVRWKNGQFYPAEIVDMRLMKGKIKTDEKVPEDHEYYVHYIHFDRRLDEWLSLDRIDLSQTVASEFDTHDQSHRQRKKRKFDEHAATEVESRDEKEAMLEALERENEEITKVKNIQCIVLGKYEIDTWYFSPYPDEYAGDEKMYICEYCLKYMKKQRTLVNHSLQCHMKSPPGRKIYDDGTLTMFEIDGREHKLYCQNLCLLSKLFLDHKTLYYDVDPFLFYALCEVDSDGHHIVGYFSKEKHSQDNYNLACILTFPPYQRKGYGKFLISLSYELTKRENTVGSPEKPLSDLGRISYRSYWAYVILSIFQDRNQLPNITVERISRMTGIRQEDILSTLHSLNMIRQWKGQHVISVNPRVVEHFVHSNAKKILLCKPECLTWQPPERVKSSGAK
jgi:histone acetyltransferase MYST1